MSDMAERVLSPITEAMARHGISADMLARQLKKELRATAQRTRKIFELQEDNTFKVSYKIEKVPLWDVQQKARIDAHKLRGDYAPLKHEHSGPDGGPIQHNHELHRALEDRLKDLEDVK